ncbi:MAG: hypothetical protein OHK005_07740 [Candidatus Methylacidiphilales bacterium]
MVIQMPDDTGDGVFLVGQDRAAFGAGGLQAMVAGSGDGLLMRQAALLSKEETDIAPGFTLVQTVETVAGTDAGLATGAFVKVHLEGILFAGLRFLQGDEVPEEIGAEALVVTARKEGNRGVQTGLVGEKAVDEIFLLHDRQDRAAGGGRCMVACPIRCASGLRLVRDGLKQH